jgi:hypothetical protein
VAARMEPAKMWGVFPIGEDYPEGVFKDPKRAQKFATDVVGFGIIREMWILVPIEYHPEDDE